MDYDVVVATMNRLDALKISVPLILGQSIRPKRFILVDASDNHSQVCDFIEKLSDKHNGEVKFIVNKSEANLPLQRNIGLKSVTSPFVFLPDDDSFWWPGVAESILRVYERDAEKIIGGVRAVLEAQLPPGLSEEDFAFRIKAYDKINQNNTRIRVRFENKYLPNPFYVLGNSLIKTHLIPSWLEEENVKVVPFMSGLCMTFRSELIKNHGYAPELGNLIGWAAGEDAEACFAPMKNHILVGAHNARVCHYRFPAKRSISGFKMGFTFLLNHIYIVCKHSQPGSKPRQILRRWALYKIMLYCAGIKNKYGRYRLKGVLKSYKLIDSFINEPPEKIKSVYDDVINRIIENKVPG